MTWTPGASFKIGESKVVSYTHSRNGLQVLLAPVPGASVCGYMRAVRTGSADEDACVPMGAAHFIEHMSFRIQNGKIWSLASKGDVINAETNMDSTRFYVVHLPHQTEETIQIDADRFKQNSVPADKVPIERHAVINELERGQQAGNAMFRMASSVGMLVHPYHNPTIGTKTLVTETTADDMERFRQIFYVPNNTTLIFCGNFDPKTVLHHVETHFGDMRRGERCSPHHSPEPPQTGRRCIEMNIPAQCPMLCMTFPLPRGASKESIGMQCISRLVWSNDEGAAKSLITDGTLHDVSTYSPRQRDPYLWFFHGTMESTSADIRQKTEQKMLETLQTFASHPVPEKTLANMKTSMRDDWQRSTESITDMMNELGRAISMGQWTDYEDRLHTLDTISPAFLQHLAQRTFQRKKMTVVHVIPAKRGESNPESTPMSTGGQISPPVAELQTKSSGTNAWSVVPVTKTANVIHVPRAKYVRMVLSARYPPKEHDMASLLVTNMGRGTYKGVSMTSALTKLHTERRFGNDHEFVHMTMEMPTATHVLVDACGMMLAHEWNTPLFDNETVELQKRHMIAELHSLKNDQGWQTKCHFIKALFHDTLYNQPIDARVQRISKCSLADLNSFHAKWVKSPDIYCTMVTPKVEHKSALEDIFPVNGIVPETTLAWQPLPRKQQRTRITLEGYGSFQIMMGQTVELRESDDDAIALAAAAQILGGGMRDRLMRIVRTDRGLGTYGLYAVVQHVSPKTDAIFCVQGTFSPDSLEDGMACTRDIIQQWHAKGVTASELAGAKDCLIGRRTIASDTVDSLKSMALKYIIEGKHPERAFQNFKEKVRNLTLEQVNNVIARRLDPDKMVEIIVGPSK